MLKAQLPKIVFFFELPATSGHFLSVPKGVSNVLSSTRQGSDSGISDECDVMSCVEL